MIGHDSHEIERKIISILRVLSEPPQPLGAKLIARRLKDYGVELGERAVRYHLQLMDERGLTRPVNRRDGREITPLGIEGTRERPGYRQAWFCIGEDRAIGLSHFLRY